MARSTSPMKKWRAKPRWKQWRNTRWKQWKHQRNHRLRQKRIMLARNRKEENRRPKKIQAVPNNLKTSIQNGHPLLSLRMNVDHSSRLVMIRNISMYLRIIPREYINGNDWEKRIKANHSKNHVSDLCVAWTICFWHVSGWTFSGLGLIVIDLFGDQF